MLKPEVRTADGFCENDTEIGWTLLMTLLCSSGMRCRIRKKRDPAWRALRRERLLVSRQHD